MMASNASDARLISEKVEGKEKNERYWCYRCEFSVQTTTKRDIQYASPVTSYIQIWLKKFSHGIW